MTEQPPRFDDLPLIEELGLRNSWGVFGPDDQVGTVNLITPTRRLAALHSVVTGRTVNLTLPLSEPSPPLSRRPSYEHTIFASGRNTNDDCLNRFYPQGSTQWDGLRHVRCREFGFYGGVTDEFEPGDGRLGIERWAQTGIIGRGVLVDIARFCAQTGRAYDPFSGEAVRPEVLTAALKHQSTEVRIGDVLCLRFGWMDTYLRLDPDVRSTSPGRDTFAGLIGSESMARFMWDLGVAALVADNPAIEVSPGDAAVGSLHRRLIPTLGFAIGELFDLRELSAACAASGRWDFCFVSVPLNIPGAVGSPGNAIAIL